MFLQQKVARETAKTVILKYASTALREGIFLGLYFLITIYSFDQPAITPVPYHERRFDPVLHLFPCSNLYAVSRFRVPFGYVNFLFLSLFLHQIDSWYLSLVSHRLHLFR